jgi:hypothetical protein
VSSEAVTSTDRAHGDDRSDVRDRDRSPVWADKEMYRHRSTEIPMGCVTGRQSPMTDRLPRVDRGAHSARPSRLPDDRRRAEV